MAFVARIFLFFQMTSVFPLLLFIFRIQTFGAMFGNIYPGSVSPGCTALYVIIFVGCSAELCHYFKPLLVNCRVKL